MKIKLYFDLNENIKKDWHSLENDNLHILPFHQYEWVKLYYDINRLKKNLTFLFILVYENEKLLLIFPFVVKKGLVNRIEYLGSPFNDINAPLYDHNSKISDEDIALIKIKILEKLKNYGDIIHFKNQPEYILSKENKFIFNKYIINKHICYRIKNNSEFLKNLLEHKFFKKLNQNEKKIKNFHLKEVKEYNEILEAFNFFYKNKFLQLEKTNKRNYLKDNLNKNFVKQNFLSKKISKEIYILKLNKILISMFFVYKVNKNIFYIYPTYNFDYSKISPGNMALKIYFQKFHNEFDYYDFTVGEEMYKEKWSNEKIFLYDNVQAFTFIGSIYYLNIKLILKLKKVSFLRKIFLVFRK